MTAYPDQASRRSGWRVVALACGSASLLLLSACQKKAEGQVVAIANGDEVTSQELNAELQNVPQAEGDQGQMIRNAALQRVIDRRLIADIAREDGLADSPDYILRREKLEETLLAQMLFEKASRDLKSPTPEQINKFIADNPQAFGSRTAFAMDQIVFPTPARGDVLQALAPAKTMAEVVSTLNRLGVKFQRGNVQADSANLPRQLFDQISSVGSSEPFIVPSGPSVTVAQVLESRSIPLVGENARRVAQQAYQRQEVSKALQQRLEAARKAAKIEYQQGYKALPSAPPAPGGAPAPAAAPAS